jgi:hypothetical protein
MMQVQGQRKATKEAKTTEVANDDDASALARRRGSRGHACLRARTVAV